MTAPDSQAALAHEHEWQWIHDWWGAHVCECGAVRENPPIDPAVAAPASLRAALERSLEWFGGLYSRRGYNEHDADALLLQLAEFGVGLAALAATPPERWGPDEEHCHTCGLPVAVVWTAPDDMWNEVVGGPGGIRCIRCFDEQAEAAGLPLLRWVPQPADIWPVPTPPAAAGLDVDGVVAELMGVEAHLDNARERLIKANATLAGIAAAYQREEA